MIMDDLTEGRSPLLADTKFLVAQTKVSCNRPIMISQQLV